jgi:hypothetical protein
MCESKSRIVLSIASAGTATEHGPCCSGQQYQLVLYMFLLSNIRMPDLALYLVQILLLPDVQYYISEILLFIFLRLASAHPADSNNVTSASGSLSPPTAHTSSSCLSSKLQQGMYIYVRSVIHAALTTLPRPGERHILSSQQCFFARRCAY